jgi:hypothetical protein
LGSCGIAPAWERFAKADTLVYIDLPLVTHGWYVTKRQIKGLFVAPEGWPKNSPLWSSSMNSYRVLWPLPSPADVEVQAAYRRRGGFEAGSPLEVTSRDGGVPRCSEARICVCLIYTVRCIPAIVWKSGIAVQHFAAIRGAADMPPPH